MKKAKFDKIDRQKVTNCREFLHSFRPPCNYQGGILVLAQIEEIEHVLHQ
jgi:hypothetical protein